MTPIERKMLNQILKNQMGLMCFLNYHEKEKAEGINRAKNGLEACMKHTRLLMEELRDLEFNVPSQEKRRD